MPIEKEIRYYKDVIVSKSVYTVSAIFLKPQWDFTWNLIKSYIKGAKDQGKPRFSWRTRRREEDIVDLAY